MKQHYGTIAITDIGPFEQSNQVITSGWYCLSSLSTIPYVKLLGSHGAQKTFSWGELVFIPDGETALVQNMSCHRGDIFINGGKDFANLPSRVTVPVPLVFTNFGEAQVIHPEYFVDTRRAKRAFLTLSLQIDSDQTVSAASIGKVLNHSHNTVNLLPIIAPFEPNFFSGIGYVSEFALPSATTYGPLPLGFRAPYASDNYPHTLLDCTSLLIAYGGPELIPAEEATAYYTLEY